MRPCPPFLLLAIGLVAVPAVIATGGGTVLAEAPRTNVRPPAPPPADAPQEDVLLSASELEDLLKGNTSEGFTFGSGNYREFYAPDGTIHGKGFKGSWWMDGDAACMSYETIATTCFRVRKLRSGAIVWELDGVPSGYARILTGNHFEF